jgi:hypothetical protein
MGELPELAEKVLAEFPKEVLQGEAGEQPKVSSQAQPVADGSTTPKSDDARRNIDVAENDAPQKESGS